MSNKIPRSQVMTKKTKILSNKTLEDRVLKSYSELIRVEEDEEYKIEKDWKDLIDSSRLTDTQCKQQFHIFEFIETEKNYINRIRAVSQVIRQLFLRLQSEGDLLEYSAEIIFGNITECFVANDWIWVNVIKKCINKTRETKQKIKPTDVFGGFAKTDVNFKPYIKFCLQQDELLERIRGYAENSKHHEDFVTYMKFCEGLPYCAGRRLAELMVEPMKRITQYPVVLREVRKRTEDDQEKEFMDLIIRKFEGFVTDINTQLRKRSENEKLQNFLLEMDEQDVWLTGDEEVISTATEYLRLPIHFKTRTEQRCLLKRGQMRIVTEGRKKLEVVAILFSDVLIMARQRKTNKKLTLVKQMYFLDKLILKKSEITNNGVILVYKNEVGLLSDALKLEIIDNAGRDSWCNDVEQAKAVYVAVRSNNGTTLDIFKEKYNPVDYDKRKDSENESLNNFKRTSSWLLTKESVEAIRKNRGKERSSSADSFRRALSDPNLLEGLDDLPDINEDTSLEDIEDESKKFGSVRESKSKNKMSIRKKLSFDSLNPFSMSQQRQRITSSDSAFENGVESTKELSSSVSQQSIDEINNNERFRELSLTDRMNNSVTEFSTANRLDNTETELSLANRVNETEIAVQTEITFSNGFFQRHSRKKSDSGSFTTKL